MYLNSIWHALLWLLALHSSLYCVVSQARPIVGTKLDSTFRSVRTRIIDSKYYLFNPGDKWEIIGFAARLLPVPPVGGGSARETSPPFIRGYVTFSEFGTAANMFCVPDAAGLIAQNIIVQTLLMDLLFACPLYFGNTLNQSNSLNASRNAWCSLWPLSAGHPRNRFVFVGSHKIDAEVFAARARMRACRARVAFIHQARNKYAQKHLLVALTIQVRNNNIEKSSLGRLSG